MKNRLYRYGLLLLVGCLGGAAFGAAVSEEGARLAARRWIHRERGFLGHKPGEPKAVVRHEQDGVGCYAVTMDDGALVVTAADDEDDPVIAFSSNGCLVKDEKRPFWALLKRTLSGRAKRTLPTVRRTRNRSEWGKLTATVSKNYGTSSVSDVRVEPLVKSKWGQEDAGGQYCYNYYTPSHDCCGCVATAMAQVMRYYGAPTAAVAQSSLLCSADGTEKTYTMKGGTYDWANMPYEPTSSSTLAERQAIGKLTYDCGVSVNMEWTYDGSGTWGEEVGPALKDYFHYANAETFSYFDLNGTVTAADRKKIICSNLDAKCPVILGISGDDGGHEIVADGYGYAGTTLYTHLNMGWEGEDDVWYNLPDIDVEGCEFDSVDQLTYNIFPDRTGEILSGRVVRSTGSAVAGVEVRVLTNGVRIASTVTDARGIYAFVLPGSVTYTVETDEGEDGASRVVTLGRSVSPTYTLDEYEYEYRWGHRWYTERYFIYPCDFDVTGMAIGNSCGNDLTLTSSLKTVSFASGGATGTVPSDLSCKAGGTVVLPSPTGLTLTGYEFAGWRDPANGLWQAGASYTVSDDVTFTAAWEDARLKKALDTELTVSGSGWEVVTGTSYDGGSALKATGNVSGGSCSIGATVTGAGTVSFRWALAEAVTQSRSKPTSKLEFAVDGTTVASLASQTSGTSVEGTWKIGTEGTHTLKWTFTYGAYTGRKNITSFGSGLLDGLSWAPTAPTDFSEAVVTSTTTPSQLGITGGTFANEAAGSAELGKLVTWAKQRNVTVSEVNAMSFDREPATELEKAFLLDCATNEVETAAAAFKVEEISVGEDGSIAVTPADGSAYGNGTVEVLMSSQPNGTYSKEKPTEGTGVFFRLNLVR